ISRELSRLLGGEIKLVSAPRVGSTFTLYLPISYVALRPTRSSAISLPPQAIPLERPPQAQEVVAREAAPVEPRAREPVPETSVPLEALDGTETLKVMSRLVNEVGDDRDLVEHGDDVVLIVENDLGFARFLLDTAREHGFKGIV